MEPENLGKVLTMFLALSGNLIIFSRASKIRTKALINMMPNTMTQKKLYALSSSGPWTAVKVDPD
jgi:hypothetical protein